jgi:photosystem II stability/assembly factor-like uncharacterized protein
VSLFKAANQKKRQNLYIYRSTDNGKSWNILISAVTQGSIALGPKDEIYILTSFSTIVFSFDYGATWKSKEITYKTETTEIGTFARCITTDNDGKIYVGSEAGVSRSDDRGNSWKKLDKGMFIKNIWSLLVCSTGEIIAGANSSLNAIYTSTDKGENWVENENVTHQIIYSLAEDSFGNIYAGGDYNLYSSTDKGRTWKTLSTINSSFTNVVVDKKNKIYSTFANGGMFSSNDSCANWEEKNNGLEKLSVFRCLLLDKNGYIWAGTNGFGIYKSKASVY